MTKARPQCGSIRKKPWNRVDQPVYSISSRFRDSFNMHICTYATPVSMNPKRYIIGLYEGTRTLHLVSRQSECVLQILQEDQFRLVRLLGKQTGWKTDKIALLEKRQQLMEWENYKVLKDCLALLKLEKIGDFPAGDHRAFLFEVVAYKNLREGKALTLDFLRAKKIIRS